MQEFDTSYKDTPLSSELLSGYGAVQPRSKPENDATIREEFEKGVAEEVISETETFLSEVVSPVSIHREDERTM